MDGVLAVMKFEWAGLSGPLRVGLLVFLLGSALDVLYHGSPPAWAPTLEAAVGPDGHRVHLVIMAGMLIIVLGLVERGLALRKQPGRPVHVVGQEGRRERRELKA